jgi:hypothetical protein
MFKENDLLETFFIVHIFAQKILPQIEFMLHF